MFMYSKNLIPQSSIMKFWILEYKEEDIQQL